MTRGMLLGLVVGAAIAIAASMLLFDLPWTAATALTALAVLIALASRGADRRIAHRDQRIGAR